MLTAWLAVPFAWRAPAALVPEQVRPTPQVKPPPLVIATVAAEAAGTIVPKLSGTSSVMVIAETMLAVAVPELVVALAAVAPRPTVRMADVAKTAE